MLVVFAPVRYNGEKDENRRASAVNFSNISYFLAIVEEGNISAASRKLYISQQALSEQLKKLEDEIGAPLLKRGKSVQMTPAGECLYRDGRELLRIYNNMMESIQDLTLSRRRRITLGVPTFGTPPYLPALLARFYAKYPEYEIAVVKRQHTDVAHNMNGVDLYISPLPLSPHLENNIVLDHDPYHAVFQRHLAERVYGERWSAAERALIETQDLGAIRQLPFIALRDRYGQLMQDLTLIFDEYHLSPVFGFSSENLDLNEHACIHGRGCLLVAESCAKALFSRCAPEKAAELLSYPIRVTSFETKTCISYRKGVRLHPAELRFIEEARGLLNQPGNP